GRDRGRVARTWASRNCVRVAACRAGNAGASKVLAVLESAQGGREAWIRVSVLTVRVVRSHRQMRLVDRQEAVHERREVVVPRSEASRRTRDVVGTAHGIGGGL